MSKTKKNVFSFQFQFFVSVYPTNKKKSFYCNDFDNRWSFVKRSPRSSICNLDSFNQDPFKVFCQQLWRWTQQMLKINQQRNVAQNSRLDFKLRSFACQHIFKWPGHEKRCTQLSRRIEQLILSWDLYSSCTLM